MICLYRNAIQNVLARKDDIIELANRLDAAKG